MVRPCVDLWTRPRCPPGFYKSGPTTREVHQAHRNSAGSAAAQIKLVLDSELEMRVAQLSYSYRELKKGCETTGPLNVDNKKSATGITTTTTVVLQ